MRQTVEVRFKGTRKAYFLWEDGGRPIGSRSCVIVEVERGRDLGRVTAVGDMAAKKCWRLHQLRGRRRRPKSPRPKPVVRRGHGG